MNSVAKDLKTGRCDPEVESTAPALRQH